MIYVKSARTAGKLYVFDSFLIFFEIWIRTDIVRVIVRMASEVNVRDAGYAARGRLCYWHRG